MGIGLEPVVSTVIRDRKSHGNLVIANYSDNSAPAEGGKKIILFCEKVAKDDIEVHFSYKNQNGAEQVQKGIFSPNDVHKQFGILLHTPALIDHQNITEEVHAQMYLYSKKNGVMSEGVDFCFLPKQFEMKR